MRPVDEGLRHLHRPRAQGVAVGKLDMRVARGKVAGSAGGDPLLRLAPGQIFQFQARSDAIVGHDMPSGKRERLPLSVAGMLG